MLKDHGAGDNASPGAIRALPSTTPRPRDLCGRPLRSLRVSVTDRCNLRCEYCMPCEPTVWLRHDNVLRFEEIDALVGTFAELGVDRVRLTGGEPLLRRDLPALVRMLARRPALHDLAMTTNGVLLAGHAAPLREAGLHRVTVSLDSLQPARFERITRRDCWHAVTRGLEAARAAGFRKLKINMVVVRGANDDEIADMLEYGRSLDAEVRFIEYMDVAGTAGWSAERVFPRHEMLQRLEERYGAVRPLDATSAAPAERFSLPDGAVFGIVASMTAPFCDACDRGRLTADGMFYLCLHERQGYDLRSLLRAGASREQVRDHIARAWGGRCARGARERLQGVRGQPAAPGEEPRLEMHVRGG